MYLLSFTCAWKVKAHVRLVKLSEAVTRILFSEENRTKKQHEIKQNSRWFSSHWHAQSPPSCVCMCFCVNTLIQIIFLSFTRSWFPKIKAVPECKHHKNPNWKWNICSVSRPKCMALYTEHDFDVLCKRSIVFVTQLCCDRLQIHSQFENDLQISVWRFLIWHNSRDYRSMSMLFFDFILFSVSNCFVVSSTVTGRFFYILVCS